MKNLLLKVVLAVGLMVGTVGVSSSAMAYGDYFTTSSCCGTTSCCNTCYTSCCNSCCGGGGFGFFW